MYYDESALTRDHARGYTHQSRDLLWWVSGQFWLQSQSIWEASSQKPHTLHGPRLTLLTGPLGWKAAFAKNSFWSFRYKSEGPAEVAAPSRPFFMHVIQWLLSKLTELRNHHHNPIFEHYHLPNKTPHVCLQLISIPTSSPRLSACNVSTLPSLNSHALGLAASMYCVQWLPRKGQCLCHRLSCAGWTQMHTQIHTYTYPNNSNVPCPAHRGEVQLCHTMLPIQLLQVSLQVN